MGTLSWASSGGGAGMGELHSKGNGMKSPQTSVPAPRSWPSGRPIHNAQSPNSSLVWVGHKLSKANL